jgi:hypothetical protein
MWLDSTSLGSGNGKSWKNIKLGIVQPLEKKQQYVDLSSRIGLYATEHNQLKNKSAYVRLAMDLIINPTDIIIYIYIFNDFLTPIESLHKIKSHIKFTKLIKR